MTATSESSTEASSDGATCACTLDRAPRANHDPTVRCEHFATIRRVVPGSDGCAECLALGRPWTELRVCLSCGHVGCCEDSPGHHAQTHFEETGHPMICAYERLETWGWCYVHHRYFDPMPPPLPQRPYVWQQWLTRVFGSKKIPA